MQQASGTSVSLSTPPNFYHDDKMMFGQQKNSSLAEILYAADNTETVTTNDATSS
ncbi:hypothetical protein Mal52_20600 [Symmachiella dynata]|uniref:Uncharacterized protein n=1 Tax=Symmachiella dynata TaxID=2527995 RepID=A0A517ZM81_9PLAN|nr:hypothetical protein Mal52_20600 [Symmachiella dynata]